MSYSWVKLTRARCNFEALSTTHSSVEKTSAMCVHLMMMWSQTFTSFPCALFPLESVGRSRFFIYDSSVRWLVLLLVPALCLMVCADVGFLSCCCCCCCCCCWPQPHVNAQNDLRGGGGGAMWLCISWHTRAFQLHGRARPASRGGVGGGWGNVVAMWSHKYIYICIYLYLRVSCRWVACPAHLRVFVSPNIYIYIYIHLRVSCR